MTMLADTITLERDEIIELADALEEARKLGTEHGNNAASWFFDGNTTQETYDWYRVRFEAGDPEAYQNDPEFATAREVCDEIGVDYDLTETSEVDQIHDAYTEEAGLAYWTEVERMASQHAA